METLVIIFSKDRAFQLDCLLRSINLRLNNLFDKVTVLYTYSNNEYKLGYDKLINRFNYVEFYKENSFYDTFMSILNKYKKEYKFISLMVDDDFIYNKLEIQKERVLKSITDQDICFSLRLGLNCVYSHPANKSFRINSYIEYGEILKTDFKNQDGDFAYPMSLDGHIFNFNVIFNYIRNINKFLNPNTLEEKLNSIKRLIKENNIIFLKESILVGNPVNLVNNTHKNRNGLIHSQSIEDLNEKYLNDYICDIDEINIENVNGCHMEFNYKFKKILK
ncbi:MAG: hypothetical protein ACOC33_00115 [bacterium]